jgi:glycosyltransferase involved in cell wall biosynthesis
MLASVLINNYNYGDFLEEAVTSVLAQSHDDIEIILVDDGSTDNSLQVIQALADTHSNIIVCSKPNGGQLSAFNAGYTLAKGEVLFFLDADDRYHPDYVAKALAVYDEHPACDFLFCAYEQFGQVNQPVVQPFAQRLTDLGYSGLLTFCRRAWIGEPTTTLSLRRSLAEQFFPIPFEKEWRIRADDCLIWLASLFNGRKFYLKEPLVGYRIHGHNRFFGCAKDPAVEYRRAISYARLFANAAQANGQYGYIRGYDLCKLLLEEAATGRKNIALLDQYRRVLKHLPEVSFVNRWRYLRKLKRLKRAAESVR